MKTRTIALGAAILAVLVAVAVVLYVISTSNLTGTARIRPADETEVIAGQTFRHYFTEAAGFTWHQVELGEGEPIVFLHGIPGAWYSWHYVMEELSDSYRTIAVDLKGLGLTERPEEGSYNAETVAKELMALMDALEIDKFALVGHEWGSMIGSYAAARYPERVTHFIRIEAPLSDAALNQIQTMMSVPQIAGVVLSDGDGFVRRMYTGESSSFFMSNVPGPVVVQPIAEADIARISREFSYEGTADSIIRYYTDTPTNYSSTVTELAAVTTMPVLLLQADSDPIQPLEFYVDAAVPFPNATFTVLANSGHVPILEQPHALAEAIRAFLTASPG
jgi:pimeloyl-ACP methyl ester carboxylesterase